MVQRKKPRPETYRHNRAGYMKFSKGGLRPLQGLNLEPWERRLVLRSLKNVLRWGFEPDRPLSDSFFAIRETIPFACDGLRGVLKKDLSKEDCGLFSKLMSWYAKSPAEFAFGVRPPTEIRELAGKLSAEGFAKIDSRIREGMCSFSLLQVERPSHKNNPTFQEMLDFQLMHDIFLSLDYIKNFLNVSRKGYGSA